MQVRDSAPTGAMAIRDKSAPGRQPKGTILSKDILSKVNDIVKKNEKLQNRML